MRNSFIISRVVKSMAISSKTLLSFNSFDILIFVSHASHVSMLFLVLLPVLSFQFIVVICRIQYYIMNFTLNSVIISKCAMPGWY